MPLPTYIGRFAPSPTGPLHFGSLVAALASYLDARSNQGQWLVRIEDLDPPREQPGATQQILHALEAHQLHWDGAVIYQSDRLEAYQAALQQLTADGQTFPCNCSRQQLQDHPTYPGHCRDHEPTTPPFAIRLKICEQDIAWQDGCQGSQHWPLAEKVGDFVIKRKDGLFAYQLAVAVDDAWQQISHVVRGIDLLDSTPRQRFIQQQLGSPSPEYAHIPVIVNDAGDKLSKQTHAPALDLDTPSRNLFMALQALQQTPPAELEQQSPAEILAWGVDHWSLAALQGRTQIPLASDQNFTSP